MTTTAAEKVALVTGASGGIGRAVSSALCQAGFTVVLAGRSLERLDPVAKAVGEHGKAHAVACDVSSPEDVENLFEVVANTCGRIDLLFNNAGIDHPGIPIEDVTFAQWTEILSTNVTGQFLCAQQAFRMMKAQSPQGGRIINNGSISAHAPRPNSIPYAVSKHAITGLTKGLMIDGRAYGIAAGQIDIGNAADTTVVQQAKSGEPVMDFAEVADAVLFMASLPPRGNAAFLTVMATNMPYVGRG